MGRWENRTEALHTKPHHSTSDVSIFWDQIGVYISKEMGDREGNRCCTLIKSMGEQRSDDDSQQKEGLLEKRRSRRPGMDLRK